MRLVDSHCHLDTLASWLEGELTPGRQEQDLAEVLARASQAQVAWLLNPAVNWENIPGVLALAERHDQVWAAVGVHPHEANSWGAEGPARLEAYARHPRVVAIGEIGLDYFYEFSPPQTQRKAFEEQLALARRLDKPVIIHSREAEPDTLALLQAAGSLRGVMHCFTGSWLLAEKALELGFYVSFSGVVSFKKSTELREVARRVPLARTLIETDAPYLAPPPHRGQRNEPAHLGRIAEQLAEIHGVELAEVAEVTSSNAEALFGVTKRP